MKHITIKKGNHKGPFQLPKIFFFVKEFQFITVTPDIYSLEYNHLQVNKIVGANHEKRIGFTGDLFEDKVAIGIYNKSAIKGIFFFDDIKYLQPGELFTTSYKPKGIYSIISYLNWPYFGGKAPAPKDMVISFDYKVTKYNPILILWDKIKQIIKK